MSLKAIQRWPSCADKGKSHPCQVRLQALQPWTKAIRAAGANNLQHVRSKTKMIVTGHQVAMLWRPWETALLWHSHHKRLRNQRRLWPDMGTEVMDIATKLWLQATSDLPHAGGGVSRPPKRLPGQQGEEDEGRSRTCMVLVQLVKPKCILAWFLCHLCTRLAECCAD